MTKDRKRLDTNIVPQRHLPTSSAKRDSRFVTSSLVGRTLLQIWKKKDKKNPDIPPMTPLKIVNLAYISHGIFMAFNDGVPLISEKVTAWDYGPIFSELFYGIMGHESKKNHIKYVPYSRAEREATGIVVLKYEERQMIKAVYEAHKYLGDSQLLSLTTTNGTPWYKTWEESPTSKVKNVSNSLIYEFYKEIKEAAQ